MAVDSAGNVYVADTNNHTIRKITPGGVVTTLAGFPGTSGTTDATGNNARFNQPRGIAVDSAGILYVADTNNHTIRKITAGAVVTTLAGLAGTVWKHRRDGQRRTVQRSPRRGGRQRRARCMSPTPTTTGFAR